MGNRCAPSGVLQPDGLRGVGHGLHQQGTRLLLSGPQCWGVRWAQQEVLRLPGGECSRKDCLALTNFYQRGDVPSPFVVPPEYVAILDQVSCNSRRFLEFYRLIWNESVHDHHQIQIQVDPDLALDMKRVRQDDCADLDGLSLDLGKWVAAGKVHFFTSFLINATRNMSFIHF